MIRTRGPRQLDRLAGAGKVTPDLRQGEAPQTERRNHATVGAWTRHPRHARAPNNTDSHTRPAPAAAIPDTRPGARTPACTRPPSTRSDSSPTDAATRAAPKTDSRTPRPGVPRSGRGASTANPHLVAVIDTTSLRRATDNARATRRQDVVAGPNRHASRESRKGLAREVVLLSDLPHWRDPAASGDPLLTGELPQGAVAVRVRAVGHAASIPVGHVSSGQVVNVSPDTSSTRVTTTPSRPCSPTSDRTFRRAVASSFHQPSSTRRPSAVRVTWKRPGVSGGGLIPPPYYRTRDRSAA